MRRADEASPPRHPTRRWSPWSRVKGLLPLLTPFLISMVFILCYCGPNLRRGWYCVADSKLTLASGPKTPTELGGGGKRVFYPYELGEQIARVVDRTCGGLPRWWSLDFWVNPDAQDRVTVKNVASAGTQESISRLFKNPGGAGHVDVAQIVDGIITDGDLRRLNLDDPDKIMALMHLYKSVYCPFVRRDSPYKTFSDLPKRGLRIYVGQQGSGARYLTQFVLRHYGITHFVDIHPERSPDQVARAVASGEVPDFDVAIILDKMDSGVIRPFLEGRFDLVSLDDVDKLFDSADLLRGKTSTHPIRLKAGTLSDGKGVPSRDVASIETQTILACSADLPPWDAYRLTRTLNEHFKDLGLGSEVAAQVPQADPGSSFDYPIHEGAARYYREKSSSETFPYQVLVVAIGASVAVMAYWNNLALKRRADRFTRRIDEALVDRHDDPDRIARELGAIKLRAVIAFKDGRLNKEGYERVNEYLAMFHKVCAGRDPSREYAESARA